MRLTTIVLLMALTTGTLAQSSYSGQQITFQYQGESLGRILDEVQRRYHLRFIYSSDLIPLEQSITVNVKRVGLQQGLEELFASTQVVFLIERDQIWLRLDPFKEVIQPTSIREVNEPQKMPERAPVELLPQIGGVDLPDSLRSVNYSSRRSATPRREVKTLFAQQEAKQEAWLDSLNAILPPGHNWIQASVFPGVSTLASHPTLVTNYASFNLLWGWHAGLKGVEIGVGVNMIVRNADGFQVGGIGNLVNGTFRGWQVGGLGNYARHLQWGVQTAGLANVTSTNSALQVAGGVNISTDSLRGSQVGGLVNVAGPASGARSIQIAGLGNVAGGPIGVQVSGLFNRADSVSQLQLGLINIADTVAGTSIGLLNLVRRGYNRVEIAGGDALWMNAALKLGSENFYNIFQAGLQWWPGVKDKPAYWSAGYGIGRAASLGENWRLNYELVAQQIMDGNEWTRRINLLGQFRMTFEWQPGARTSAFLGPVWNTYVSEVTHPETGQKGHPIAPYTLIDYQGENKPRVQSWLGATAGIRF